MGSGDDIRLVERPDESLSVADIDALLYLPRKQADDLRRAVRIEALSEGWRQSFTELLKDLDDAQGAAGWAGFKPLTVTGVESESADVTSLVLSASDGSRLPPARGGQHLTVRVPAGPRGEAVIRNYSISDFFADGGYRISVKRERLGVASSWFQRCAMAADLNVETTVPAGEFTLDAVGDEPLLFVSAGIGITPLLSMLRELAERRADQRVVWWHVARDASSRVFRDESLAMATGWCDCVSDEVWPKTSERTWSSPRPRSASSRRTEVMNAVGPHRKGNVSGGSPRSVRSSSTGRPECTCSGHGLSSRLTSASSLV